MFEKKKDGRLLTFDLLEITSDFTFPSTGAPGRQIETEKRKRVYISLTSRRESLPTGNALYASCGGQIDEWALIPTNLVYDEPCAVLFRREHGGPSALRVQHILTMKRLRQYATPDATESLLVTRNGQCTLNVPRGS